MFNNRWLVLATVSSALLMIVMDLTILYTALPRLTFALGASASEKLWIVNAYSLVIAGVLPVFGALGDRWGHRNLFLAGLGVFGAASLICAYAPNPQILIAGRVVLALGGGMMMPATLSIIRLTFTDPREQAMAIGIWSAVAAGGAAAGPVVGGVLLEFFWWGSVFLVNLPIVIIALTVAATRIRNRQPENRRPLDWRGAFEVMFGLIATVYAFKEIVKRDPSFAVAAITGLLGIVTLVLFARRQRRIADPMIDFALFADVRFSSAILVAFVSSVSIAGFELVFSQRLQLVDGLSPLNAGLYILPAALASLVAGPVAGLLIPRWGQEPLLWTGTLLGGASMAGAVAAFAHSGALTVAGLIGLGFGIGVAMTAASSAIINGSPPHRTGMAASMESVAYDMGAGIGVAVFGGLMSAAYTYSFVMPDGIALPGTARDSLEEAIIAAGQLPAVEQLAVEAAAKAGFVDSFYFVSASVALVLIATALVVYARSRSSRLRHATAER
ncbi:MFS transporter [Hoeflea poritis]|uniref:MFS transporter n=1 Tax=Hoeflea poritis TaxID=2993659 RepID=A0ABT4VR11_9HYPH|nr:MFS transporter [Hoeflea poritis]MDA4847144.1 MFS transporter [Hoeflea poritis]